MYSRKIKYSLKKVYPSQTLNLNEVLLIRYVYVDVPRTTILFLSSIKFKRGKEKIKKENERKQ